MPALIIRHRVGDFAKWKPQFDAHEATRQAFGATGHKLFRIAKDPNDVLIVITCDDLERMRVLAESADIKEVMQRAGVLGTPTYFYVEDIEDAEYVAAAKATRPEAQPPS